MPDCSICLGSTKDTFVSQCNHSFCNTCILQWIMCHDECPLCRSAISAPSRNNIVYEEDEDVPFIYKFYLIGSTTPHETKLVHERVNDFIISFEDINSESKYKWVDNHTGSYNVVRNEDYFLDLCFNIHTHNNIQNCYIIMGKVTKRVMEKPSHIKQKKNKYNTYHNRHNRTHRSNYFLK